jgi:nitrite reductase/ring-hydroxylating ferredoxin subunit
MTMTKPQLEGHLAGWEQVADLDQLKAKGSLTVHTDDHVIVLFLFGGQVYAVDNRCPHMGFPLDKGTVRDGILTCHWHHARFDLASGGTFDQFADDVRSFPARVEGKEIWLDLRPQGDYRERQQKRLRDGLERNLRLVVAKSVLGLLQNENDRDTAAAAPFGIGLDYGARNRRAGWSNGQTINTLLINLLPHLENEDKPRALYTGLNAVGRDCSGQPARFALDPLPNFSTDLPTLKKWFRQFVEVRDSEGAERCLVSAVEAGHSPAAIADMLFAAATDHRYLETGHLLDYINKAFEALDRAGWGHAPVVLASLAPVFAEAARLEETNEWQQPVNLVGILQDAFTRLPQAIEEGTSRTWDVTANWDSLVDTLLGDEPQATSDALLAALRQGATFEELAQVVAYGAVRRVAQFHISNEFGDWNTVHHTYTYANALHQAMRRSPSPELLRGVWDGAMSIYLDRFLNIPATRLPQLDPAAGGNSNPETLLEDLLELFNRQQQVNQAGELVARYLASGADPARLVATLGKALLREDAGFHLLQCVEASTRQYYALASRPETAPVAYHALVAAGRFLGAHFPTPRSANQTYQIALRLQRGEKVFEE